MLTRFEISKRILRQRAYNFVSLLAVILAAGTALETIDHYGSGAKAINQAFWVSWCFVAVAGLGGLCLSIRSMKKLIALHAELRRRF
ncbi:MULTISPECIES: hypothetical protein [unclassified Curtobacterium]|uniref:hypothetical protein n=1 Tax=unclassified Curtobacterium TaxID=257496 RepID=UPI0011B66FEF|nr:MULTISPECIES: hypothetical protein [unclassified Curtobacterium]